jgi:hypothetical protein
MTDSVFTLLLPPCTSPLSIFDIRISDNERLRILLKLLRGWQNPLELPSAQIERKNNGLDCPAKNKPVRCGHNRLSPSRFMRDVEGADAWKNSRN